MDGGGHEATAKHRGHGEELAVLAVLFGIGEMGVTGILNLALTAMVSQEFRRGVSGWYHTGFMGAEFNGITLVS